MKKVVIIDYGMGNVDSVGRAVEDCGGSPLISDKPQDLESADYIILPGVGAFSDGIRRIREKNIDEALTEKAVNEGVPFLGICLGMQIIARRSHEGGLTNGLGWIDGEIIRLKPKNKTERIPHVGWNEVIHAKDAPIFNRIPSGKDFYFVHSYHLSGCDEKLVIARTPYCGEFVSAVRKNNIFGVQFHPEKSQTVGLQVIKNFLSL